MPDWVQWVSFMLGSIGTILGGLATYAGLMRDRVRIQVRSALVRDGRNMDKPARMGVEVVNTGFVAVTIDSVGFTTRKPRNGQPRLVWFPWITVGRVSKLYSVIRQDADGGARMPYRLEPRTAILITTAYAADDPTFENKIRSEAHTACGLVILGPGPKRAKECIKVKL